MATPVLQPAFTTGEIAPNLFGRQDLARAHTAATTLRNMFVSYKGGAYSRPGTRFVSWSKQTGRDSPPRLIPFQFSVNQGLILEFGNHYMRVIQNGAMVTENPIPITNVTQANPGVVTALTSSGSAATPSNTAIITSYAPGDTISLAGGVFVTPAVLLISDTILLSCALNAPGSGYAPADTITLAGGTHSVAAKVTIATTRAVSATIASAGTGGAPGPATVTGTTGTGTKFQANVTIGGTGVIASVDSIAVPGIYTVNPTTPTNEPVTGGGLTGAHLNVSMGVNGFSVSTGGDYTVNPAGGNFTQGSTTGSGTGATFQSGIFGPLFVTFSNPGTYTSFPTNPVGQAFSSGGGIGAKFNIVWTGSVTDGLNTGDWVFFSDVQGMTQLNGQTYVVQVISPSTFSLTDVFGNPVDTTNFPAYAGGGTVARIYTVPTIYDDADLEWLKFVQSADVMTLCCVNQLTGAEYPPQDLARLSDTDWVFTPVIPVTSIAPPPFCTLSSSAPSGLANYGYCVTSVAKDGTESIPCPPTYLGNAVDVAATAGSITITWPTVPGAVLYNVYKAEVNYAGRVPDGVLYGFAGQAFGAELIDSNIVADFQQVPPTHRNPFARGQIIGAVVDNGGSGYNPGIEATVVVTSSTGSGAVIDAVISGDQVVAFLVLDTGSGYVAGDTLTVFNSVGGGATGHITLGPESGTYPGVPSYFQQRRVFADSLNNPDTYWMSQPGAFRNFDSRIPTIASDAIVGTPWSLQVNGIQFFVTMPAGLAAFTGLSAWLLVGAGSFATNVQPISPSSQVAQPLAFSGCSPTVPPIKINYDVIYVGSKGSYYYDLPYQLYALSEPIDLTIFSSHLFDNFTLREHTWAETPFKLLWTVRSDGCLLSLTFLKQQQVAGWARHDTNGLWSSVASCVEPVIATPELGDLSGQKADAVYLVTGRAGDTLPPVPPPAAGGWNPIFTSPLATLTNHNLSFNSVPGDVVMGVAVDVTAQKIWFFNPWFGGWNFGTLTSQNPSTAAGGLSFSIAGSIFPAVSLVSSASVTLNAGASAFQGQLPAGFTAWGSSTTWDPAGAGAEMILSNGNLTAVGSGSAPFDWHSLIGTVSHSTGQFYFELTINATGNMLIGIGNSSTALAAYIGSDVNSGGIQNSGDQWSLPSGHVHTGFNFDYVTNDSYPVWASRQALGITGYSTGKYYFEVTINALVPNSGVSIAVGIATHLQLLCGTSLGGGAALGTTTNSLGYQDTGDVIFNGGSATGGTGAVFIAGATISIAADLGTQKIWIYDPTTGHWNGDILANQNPVGEIGGVSFAGMTGLIYPAAEVRYWITNDEITANFGGLAFLNPVPAGYLPWG